MTELERVAEQYANENYLVDEVPIPQVYAEAFMAGANWRYEQFEKERLKHCDELTAEQAQIESDFVVQHLKNFNRTPTFIDAIEYGRKQMIDKACEYINNHWDKLLVYEYNQFGGSVFNRKKTVEQFRKAMEE